MDHSAIPPAAPRRIRAVVELNFGESRHMPDVVRRFCTAALLVAAVLSFIVPAGAVPPRVRIERPMLSPVPRVTRATAMHGVFAPLLVGRRSVRPGPIATFPSLAPVRFQHAFPALLPRIGLATLIAPFDLDACANRRSTTLLATIPTSPFMPMSCRWGSGQGDGLPAVNALVPGGNKKALYGPSYSPSGGSDP